MEQNQRGINKADGKIIWKEERPQRNSWFDEEHLENKKKACNNMINRNTRHNEQEHKDKKRCT
jgi:hypothetical protein